MENIDIMLELVACKTFSQAFFFHSYFLIHLCLYPTLYSIYSRTYEFYLMPTPENKTCFEPWINETFKGKYQGFDFLALYLEQRDIFLNSISYIFQIIVKTFFFIFIYLVSDVLRKPHSPGSGSGSSPRTSMEPKVLQ